MSTLITTSPVNTPVRPSHSFSASPDEIACNFNSLLDRILDEAAACASTASCLLVPDAKRPGEAPAQREESRPFEAVSALSPAQNEAAPPPFIDAPELEPIAERVSAPAPFMRHIARSDTDLTPSRMTTPDVVVFTARAVPREPHARAPAQTSSSQPQAPARAPSPALEKTGAQSDAPFLARGMTAVRSAAAGAAPLLVAIHASEGEMNVMVRPGPLSTCERDRLRLAIAALLAEQSAGYAHIVIESIGAPGHG